VAGKATTDRLSRIHRRQRQQTPADFDPNVKHLLSYWYDNKWQGQVFSPTDVAVGPALHVFTTDLSHNLVQEFAVVF